MKKLVFTAQVFSLIAMFPIVAVLEINHTKGSAFKRGSALSVVQEQGKKSILLTEKEKDKMINEAFFITLKTLLLNKVF
jgi:hypothetical protein